jgi:hypothetical protein
MPSFIPWHKNPYSPPQNDHKSNLFPKYKNILWWRCFREFVVNTLRVVFLISSNSIFQSPCGQN